jgi:hypothetical protein
MFALQRGKAKLLLAQIVISPFAAATSVGLQNWPTNGPFLSTMSFKMDACTSDARDNPFFIIFALSWGKNDCCLFKP